MSIIVMDLPCPKDIQLTTPNPFGAHEAQTARLMPRKAVIAARGEVSTASRCEGTGGRPGRRRRPRASLAAIAAIEFSSSAMAAQRPNWFVLHSLI